MSEKTYKTMRMTGAGNIVVGIILLVCGVACGVLSIINGSKLLKQKSEVIF